MKSREGLKSFCLDLSSSDPSPGGGSAAAAAGGMAASLLIMVCSIALKSKEGQPERLDLEAARKDLEDLRDELVMLAEEDSKAYDAVVLAASEKRKKGDSVARDRYEKALEKASEVPARTAEACLMVLELGERILAMARRSTLSDVGTAIALAHAAVRGAYLNVTVNLDGIEDEEYVRLKRSKLNEILTQADALAGKLLGPMVSTVGKQP